MRAYEPYKLFKPQYPVDFAKIKHFLVSNGKLHINDEALEDKYCDFSAEKGCGWIAPYRQTLEEFATYLYNIELDDTPEDPEVVIPEDPEPSDPSDPIVDPEPSDTDPIEDITEPVDPETPQDPETPIENPTAGE